MSEQPRPKKTGRPSKGDRRPRLVRFPSLLDGDLVEGAEAAGYSNLNDYIVDVVAIAQGRSPYYGDPGRRQHHADKEQLSFSA